MKDDISLENQIQSIWNSIEGFHVIYFIYTGYELDLFNIIKSFGDKGASPNLLSEKKLLHHPYIEKWCNSGIAWKILDILDNDNIILAPHMDAILTKKGDPRFLLPYIKSCVDHFGPDMKSHSDYYKSGKIYTFQEHSHNFSNDIGSITEGLQTLITNKIIPNNKEINDILMHGGSLLDFGCGTAKLLTKLSNRYPKALFYGLDIDKNGIKIANDKIKKENKLDFIKIYDGNSTLLPANDSINIITMVEVFHEISKNIRPIVLSQVHKYLKPNGILLILDETMPNKENLRHNNAQLAVLTQYNEMTWGNEVPTKLEQDNLLLNAGFLLPERKIIGGLFTLLICKQKENN